MVVDLCRWYRSGDFALRGFIREVQSHIIPGFRAMYNTADPIPLKSSLLIERTELFVRDEKHPLVRLANFPCVLQTAYVFFEKTQANPLFPMRS